MADLHEKEKEEAELTLFNFTINQIMETRKLAKFKFFKLIF